MLLTLVEVRNRMLNCKPDASISITFREDEVIRLEWVWASIEDGVGGIYHVDVNINHISVSCRSFERQMHKAKRFMKHNQGGGCNGQANN